MKRISSTPVDTINYFYNRIGDIVESNQSKQLVTWANNIDDNEINSVNRIPGTQVPHPDDNSNSRDKKSIDIFDEENDIS